MAWYVLMLGLMSTPLYTTHHSDPPANTSAVHSILFEKWLIVYFFLSSVVPGKYLIPVLCCDSRYLRWLHLYSWLSCQKTMVTLLSTTM